MKLNERAKILGVVVWMLYLHQMRNVMDAAMDAVRVRRWFPPLPSPRKHPRCQVCRSRFSIFTSRNQCNHCRKRWPHLHENRAYGHPTEASRLLARARGQKPYGCLECGHPTSHSRGCGVVS